MDELNKLSEKERIQREKEIRDMIEKEQQDAERLRKMEVGNQLKNDIEMRQK